MFITNGCDLPEEFSGLDNITVYPADSEPVYSIDLVRETFYGDTDNTVIGRISGITVDDGGRVFIGDRNGSKIHIFNPDGSYLQGIGRDGEGPGEFRNIGAMRTGDGLLHILDTNLKRVSQYDLETLTHVKDINLVNEQDDDNSSVRSSPTDFFLQSDGSYLIHFGMAFITDSDDEHYTTVSNFDTRENRYTAHDVITFRANEMLMIQSETMFRIAATPYKRKSVIRFNNGQLVYGWSEWLFFKFFDESGEYRHAIYYPSQNPALIRNDAIGYYNEEYMQQAVRNDQIPETFPAFNNLRLDDQNYLWVSTITGDSDNYDWWVLNEDGTKLAQFTWPRSQHIELIRTGYVYMLEEDEMGVVQVVRYRIELG